MKKKTYWICLFLVFLITGCAEPKTLEQIGLITTGGYDIGDDGMIEATMYFLHINPEAEKKTALLTEKAYTSRGVRIKSNLASAKKLQSGQLRVVLYSEKLAEKGIISLTDTLTRDPAISELTYLAIAKGGAKDLLNTKNDKIPDVGLHIYKEILQNNKNELIPSSTLQETLHDYYSAGVDPILPIIEKVRGNIIAITGLGILKNDKLVGNLTITQSFFIKLIRNRNKAGNIELPIESDSPQLKGEFIKHKKLAVALDTIKSQSDIHLKNKDSLEFDLNIKLNARLLEINSHIDLEEPKNVKLLEKEIKKKMKTEIENLISYCQSVNSDVIGFGEIYRSSVRHSNLTRKKWLEMYENAKVNVNVEFTLVSPGLVE